MAKKKKGIFRSIGPEGNTSLLGAVGEYPSKEDFAIGVMNEFDIIISTENLKKVRMYGVIYKEDTIEHKEWPDVVYVEKINLKNIMDKISKKSKKSIVCWKVKLVNKDFVFRKFPTL